MIHARSNSPRFITLEKAPKYLKDFIINENNGVLPEELRIQHKPAYLTYDNRAWFWFKLNGKEYNLHKDDII